MNENAVKPMTVVHVAPTPFFSDRGCHIRIEGIVCALNARGSRNVLCTYHHGRDREGIETRRIAPVRGYNRTVAGPDPRKYVAAWKLLFLVIRTLRSEKPAMVHGHLHEGVFLAWLAIKLNRWFLLGPRVPLVADIQGSLVGELDAYGYFGRSAWLRGLFRWIEWCVLRLPAHLFCSSASSLDMVKHGFGVPDNRITLLQDGVDVSAIDRSTACACAPGMTVIYTGSLLPVKGLRDLHEVIARLLRERGDIRAVLVGYPVEETKAFLAAAGLSDRCTLTGRVSYDELPGWLKSADIALEPKGAGTGEGSGKILNYMAASLPVVCFDSANNRAFLGDAKTFVPSGDIGAFVSRIEELADDPALRRAEGERNRRRALEEFSWGRGAEKIVAVYKQLAE
jgi:glycosyltransferase involved in cell wall biosynthesis